MFANIRRWSYGLLTGIACMCALQPAQAGDPDYNVLLIPAALRAKVHVVKRLEEISVVVNGPDDVRTTRHYVLTILDRKGEEYARFVEYYDKLREIRSVHGALYDAMGKQLKRVKQGDIGDYSASDGFSLATDNRVRSHSFEYSNYPYTVEYEVEVKANNNFDYPTWIPQREEAYSVEQSTLKVTVPEKDTLRYRSFHYRGEPTVTNEKGTRTYTWQVNNLGALPEEESAPEWYTRTTSVFLAPCSFSMQQYNGNMNTWEQFGNFMYVLNQGRDVLPPDVKQTVHQLTDGLPPNEKIAKLYKYMQEHTRYVSVQLGIGGWQTFDAAYVASKGYGDCKALSNYMCSLLREAGLRANYVLVHAGEGENDFLEDFPSNQFNHVIVCVPNAQDTTWLECTSSSMPPGYLGSFTCNRPVLVTSEKGSKLVHTPIYNMAQNQQIRHVDATIDANGDMLVKASTHYTGEEQDEPHGRAKALSKEKLMEHLKEEGLMPSYDVNRYTWQEFPAALPAFDDEMELAAHNYATVTGKRMFIQPNLLSKSEHRYQQDSARQSNIALKYCYHDVDTVKIAVPEGYTPESMPQPVSVESPFGVYSSMVKVDGHSILYVRSLERKQGEFPAADFPKLEAFYNAIYKADRAKLVLVKQ
jgi:transglutaminase-like putative cysteine protease